MARILFCHWFWITLVSGLLLSAAAEDESEELEMVRRGHSFASHRTEPSSSSGQSVSVSNSVSHVRVEVGNKKHQPAKILKKKIKKKFKSRKTFLEKIYAKIKEFARVTLATRRGETVTEPSTSGQDNSETAGNQARDPGAEPQPALGTQPAPRPSTQPSPSTQPAPAEAAVSPGANVVSFSEFSPGPRQPGQRGQGDQAGADTEASEEQEQEVKQEEVTKEAEEAVPPPRSPEARGRSLWLVARPRQPQEEGEVAGAEADTAGPSFASWSRERELVWGSGEEAGQLQLGRWSTLVILGVSGATAAAFITVLVAALLYRRAKFRAAAARHCEQLSDTVSTSSRSSASTASTISSTRSTRSSVPDKMDIISFHAEGNLRKQAYNCDDLYSLDSDYFLSSLEDISVQI